LGDVGIIIFNKKLLFLPPKLEKKTLAIMFHIVGLQPTTITEAA
jgi:hypothetical protein